MRTSSILTLILVLFSFQAYTQKDAAVKWESVDFSGIEFRSIGPAFMSGRIADIVIHPDDNNLWYVAVGSGGVWKTENAGTTWKPIFDDQSSYSIGCVTIDPNNPHTVWVGTGENVGGRHVGYGDGVYRTTDGGKSWKNMGLKASEHISKIIVHPSDPNTVWVAAQGPLWSKGGERGLYKTTDGGQNWKKTLGDEEWTGVTDILIDPRNSDRLYAATWQRHRTIAAYIGGGPETAIYRSEDGGESWEKLKDGLPTSNMGKIGLAISPQQPDVVYAAIELDRRKGGVYKSTDRGVSWKKQSDAVSGATGPHYYQELYASPHAFDRLYLVDVRMQVSDDGGKNFRRMKEEYKHSDNHSVAFRMDDPDYLLVGTDGGIYESFDLAENWRFIDNLPITQFYKLALDDAEPFYNVYGGTQDNNTQGGPSRTDNVQGIQNGDWKVVLNWDGHEPATEPGNPNIMYGQRQQGTLARIDLKTGEVVDIQPQPEEGEDYERFNWDAPIFISPHSPKRLYFGSQRLWRSDDRGDSWTAVSGDLTKDLPRIEQPIFDRQQSWDNPWDLYAMSEFSTLTSISESPLKEGLIYIGTDDGIIQRTADGGQNWTKIEVGSLPGVPGTAYVNDIKASLHDTNTLYIALDNHKHGDFAPYLLKSTDRGNTWSSIAGTIPDRHLVWRIAQDHINPELIFIGTEYGIFFSHNGGQKWTQLKGGLPTISFRDLEIQERENDLVGASFGRSFYVLDDYSVLREVTEADLQKDGALFSTRDAWWYIPRPDLSFSPGKGSQGSSYYIAPNPPFGAVFTYYIGEMPTTIKEERQKEEKELNKEKKDVPFPGWEELDREKWQKEAVVWLTVANDEGQVVRRIPAPASKGFHRIAWDLKYPSPSPISLDAEPRPAGKDQPSGFMAAPGQYTVTLSRQFEDSIVVLDEPVQFSVKPLREGTLEGAPEEEVADFWRSYEQAARSASALQQELRNAMKKVNSMLYALQQSQLETGTLDREVNQLRLDLLQFNKDLNGSPSKDEVGVKSVPTISNRLFAVSRAISNSTYGPTETAHKNMDIINEQLVVLNDDFNKIREKLENIETELEESGSLIIEGE